MTGSSQAALVLEFPFDQPLPDLGDIAGPMQQMPERRLTTRVLDTADRRLWHRGFILRHQCDEAGDGGIWMVERPGEREWGQLMWPGEGDDLPPSAELLAGILRREPLGTVSAHSTLRHPFVWRDPTGVRLGEVDDDTMSVRTGRHDGRRLRRITVTFGPASDAGRDRLVARLCSIGAVPEDPTVTETVLGVDEDPQRPPKLDERSSAGDVVRTTLAAGLDRLLDHDWRIRLRSRRPDVEDIHQARVATRRLRSDLQTFRPILDPVWVSHRREELRWLGDRLGRLRDIDVLDDRLRSGAAEVPGVDTTPSAQCLGHLRDEAATALAESMASRQYLDLLDRLHAAAGQPPFYGARSPDDPARRVLPGLVAAQWRRLRRRVRQVSDPPTDDELHRIRIAAKQLRYAAEAVAPVIGRPARRTAKAAEALQTVLGEHHDAASTEAWLRAAAAADPSTAFAAGWLGALERREQLALRAAWQRSWRDVKATSSRRWIT